MPGLPRYHIGEQSAYALLQPVQTSLGELEARTRHYLTRLHLHDERDREALMAATEALTTARSEIERLVAGSRPHAGAST